jgi:hypothetical protein
MAGISNVSGVVFARGTLYDTLQVRAWKITPVTALTADTQSGGAGTAITRGTISAVAAEFGTTGMLFQAKSDGTSFVVIGDAHAINADIIAKRADKALGGTGALTSADNAATATTALLTGVVAVTSVYGIA